MGFFGKLINAMPCDMGTCQRQQLFLGWNNKRPQKLIQRCFLNKRLNQLIVAVVPVSMPVLVSAAHWLLSRVHEI